MRVLALSSFVLALACSPSSPTAAPPATVVPEPAEAEVEPAEAPARSIGEHRYDAGMAYQAKDWESCAEAFDAVLEHPEASDTDAYNAACCHALAGHSERALDILDDVASRGEASVDLVRRDDDLASLHEHPRWEGVVAKFQANLDAYLATINRELFEMFQADQSERRQASAGTLEWEELARRDRERLARALEIVEAGEAEASDDWYHAAMIMQHGDVLEDYQRAHEWAVRAAEADKPHPKARWLAAAAKDRWLLKQDLPQMYGTQFVREGDRWVLYEVDPEVTDEERARWDVPPLAEAKARAERMNE